MQTRFILLAAALLLTISASAQNETPRTYTNFPIIITVQFHALSLPFRNLKSNFKNVGIGIGTEVSHNGQQNWVTQMGVLWYRNRNVGNGFMPHLQTVWRPTLADDVYTEIKAGLGYLISSRPSPSWRQVNGVWQPAGHKGKGMFTVPLGVSLGANTWAGKTQLSPFVTYQFMLVTGYSASIPLVPETLIQTGARVHIDY
ncbi:MAG: hypothetical protein MUE95_04790 [Cyclobacteriaceae bacterium]|jgi:hypothetical protein|nr:hypothetical protein [Cyclobacteriaceae bacterium]